MFFETIDRENIIYLFYGVFHNNADKFTAQQY